MTIYVLMMLMWTPSMHTSGALATAEFTSKENCESAATIAKKKFDGWGTELYYVCVPK